MLSDKQSQYHLPVRLSFHFTGPIQNAQRLEPAMKRETSILCLNNFSVFHTVNCSDKIHLGLHTSPRYLQCLPPRNASNPNYKGNMFLRNVGVNLQTYSVSKPRRLTKYYFGIRCLLYHI
jgi:hypothetical protein